MRKKHHLLLTFLVTLFALLDLSVCATGTYAWFVTKNTVDTSGISMKIYTQDLDLTYKIYKYLDDDKRAIDATDDPNGLVLTKYDSVITSRNENTAIILEFNISGEVPTGHNSFCLSAHCTNGYTDTRYLSNIIGLKFAVTDSITGNDADTLYHSATTYFNNAPVYTFKNNSTKVLDIDYSINNYSNYLHNGVLKLYLQLDYVPELVKQFEFSFDDISTTSFTNDLTLINCYIEA